MGTRAQIGIRQHGGEMVWLYTHWSGDTTPVALAAALSRHERRTEEQYLARIIWDALVSKDEHGGATGYGISTWPISDANCPFLVVDPVEQRVTMHDARDPEGAVLKSWTFAEFAQTGQDAFSK